MLKKKNLFGIGITDASIKEVLEYLIENIEKGNKKIFIATPNPEMILFANKNSSFKETLNKADLALCDGMGLYWAFKFLGKPLKERITGVDFMEKVCFEVSESNLDDAKKPITVGFLGSGHGVAVKTAECLVKKYPGLKVVFASEEWENKILRDEDTKILSDKEDKKSPNILISQYPNIDILFVAFGFPKQEEWIVENLNKIPVKVAIGVGGAFDYISGKVPRAPKLVQKIGFEWLFRLFIQPWRIKRQISLLFFPALVLREKTRI